MIPLRIITLVALAVTSSLNAQSRSERVFDGLDRDGDGVLDREEFGRSRIARRMPDRFDQLDIDGDGTLTREEITRARAAMRKDADQATVATEAGTTTLRWTIDGEERTALVHMPALAAGERAPLVFVWHGHGGRSGGAARQFGIQDHWPEAIVVHPQGLPTPGKLTDPEGLRSGWRSGGPAATNRDLKFFDAMYEDLIERGIVDPELVYSTGHSNGGGFTYTLLVERGERLAAIAPSSSASSRHRGRAFPKIPIFHLAGRNDTLVKMAWQQATIDHLRRLYECGDPKPWGDHPDCRIHPSPGGDLLVTCVHDGTHRMPDDAGELFTRFFRDHARTVRAERSKIDWTTPKVDAPRVSHHRFPSEAAGSPVSYHLYTPAVHDLEPERRFPVVYWLHGTGGGLAGIAPLARRFDQAIEAGSTPPCLVVFVNGLATGMYVDWKDGSVPVERMIIDDLLPHVDATHRTIASREGRMLDGFSMGGYGAARLGFKRPDLFGAVSLLGAGPLQEDLSNTPGASRERADRLLETVYGGDESYFREVGPRTFAARNADPLRKQSIVRLVVGDADVSFRENQRFHRHLEKLGIPHEWIVLPDVGHDPVEMLEALGDRNWAFHQAAFRPTITTVDD